jgi:hypothetical protein
MIRGMCTNGDPHAPLLRSGLSLALIRARGSEFDKTASTFEIAID